MTTKPLVAACLIAVCAAPAASVAADSHPFNVDDLVQLDHVSSPQLSPDGSRVAFTVAHPHYDENKNVPAVYVLNLDADDAEPTRLANHASSPRWSSDGDSVYFLSGHDVDHTQLWSVPAGGGDRTQVTHYPVAINGYRMSPDGQHAAVSMDVFADCDDLDCTADKLQKKEDDQATGRVYDKLLFRHWDTWSDHRLSQLFVLDLDDAADPVRVSKGVKGQIPSQPFGGPSEFSFSPDGKTVYFDARLANHKEAWSTNFDIYRVPADGSESPENLTEANKAHDGWPVPAPDGKTLYYLAQKVPGAEADRFAIKAMDLDSGDIHEVDPDFDHTASNLQVSDDGKHLYVTAPDRMQMPLFQVNPDDGSVDKLVDKGTVVSYTLANGRIVIGRNNVMHPTMLYSVDADSGDRERLTHFNDKALSQTERGHIQYFHFKGAKNDPVYGFVVTPTEFDKDKEYPVAFLVHGGPQGVFGNSWSFRWNPQTYAGQGFAVATVNFHGSIGFGQDFTDSISGDWGGKPLTDLKKGWNYALDQYDWLNGDDACALGASYGGYMVYWMASQWKKPWSCMVDHDGVFNTRGMYYATEELWFEEHENGGKPEYKAPKKYAEFNPMDHVDEWDTPMLVVHSEKDFRIPISQGLSAFTALQRQGIPSKLLTFPDENHWIIKPHNKVQWLNTINGWLHRWMDQDTDKGSDSDAKGTDSDHA